MTHMIYPNITSLPKAFKGILLDAYGVFWGGNDHGLLPGAREAMERMVSHGTIVGILSNSTALAAKEIEKYERHGITLRKHFDFLLTSGEIARFRFLNKMLPFKTPQYRFWVLGEPHPKFSSHIHLFEGTPYIETKKIEEADFIYAAIPHVGGEDRLDPEEFRDQVKKALPFQLPMVCANPDLFAHEGNPPKAVVRQGSIARMYEEMGGKVYYIGKPHNEAYIVAMDLFKKHQVKNPQDVLMVGDTPETDIQGARSFGMSSALVTETGIMGDRIKQSGFEKTMKSLTSIQLPDYFIERLKK